MTNRVEDREGQVVLLKAEIEGLGSLLFQLQRECIAYRKALQDARIDPAPIRDLLRRAHRD